MPRLPTVIACGLALVTQGACTDGSPQPLPAWVSEAIADQHAARGRPMLIEECTFDGKTTYLFTRLDAAEVSDADTLYSQDGKPLCRFGEFVPPGAPNPCDRKKLTCKRTLHPLK
jgi:hypothetical protein